MGAQARPAQREGPRAGQAGLRRVESVEADHDPVCWCWGRSRERTFPALMADRVRKATVRDMQDTRRQQPHTSMLGLKSSFWVPSGWKGLQEIPDQCQAANWSVRVWGHESGNQSLHREIWGAGMGYVIYGSNKEGVPVKTPRECRLYGRGMCADFKRDAWEAGKPAGDWSSP